MSSGGRRPWKGGLKRFGGHPRGFREGFGEGIFFLLFLAWSRSRSGRGGAECSKSPWERGGRRPDPGQLVLDASRPEADRG